MDMARLLRDEESAKGEDSPAGKRPKPERFPLSPGELAVFVGVFFFFVAGLFCIYKTMPAAEYGKIKLPRTVSDLRVLKWVQLSPIPRFLVVGACFVHCLMV